MKRVEAFLFGGAVLEVAEAAGAWVGDLDPSRSAAPPRARPPRQR